MDLTQLEWRKCPHHEETYEISERGDIRRTVNKGRYKIGHLLKHQIDKYGYHRVVFSVDKWFRVSHSVHYLVAYAFISPPPDSSYEPHHIIHDKDNNHYSNLKWLTRRQNVQESWESRDRRLTVPRGEMCGNAKLLPDDILEIRRLAGEGKTQREIANLFGISRVNVGFIVKRKTWAHIPETTEMKMAA